MTHFWKVYLRVTRIFVFCVVITNCLSCTSSPKTTLIPQPSPPITATLETSTTPSPQYTPLSTPVSQPSLAPTQHPVKDTEENYEYVKKMLQTNGNCELPCWWGIIPGQSEWQQTQNLPGHHFRFYPDEKSEYVVNLTFRRQAEVVDGIIVTGRVQGNMSSTFTEDWDKYSLNHILSRYGIPSAGYIALVEDKPGYAFYLLLLHYQDRGFAIRYYHNQAIGSDFEKLGTTYKTCFPLRDITLWLQSPQSSVPLDIYMDELTWSSVIKIEEATGMTLEEFYDTFRYPGTCLEIPPTG